MSLVDNTTLIYKEALLFIFKNINLILISLFVIVIISILAIVNDFKIEDQNLEPTYSFSYKVPPFNLKDNINKINKKLSDINLPNFNNAFDDSDWFNTIRKTSRDIYRNDIVNELEDMPEDNSRIAIVGKKNTLPQ